jgi:hypothetical protein
MQVVFENVLKLIKVVFLEYFMVDWSYVYEYSVVNPSCVWKCFGVDCSCVYTCFVFNLSCVGMFLIMASIPFPASLSYASHLLENLIVDFLWFEE